MPSNRYGRACVSIFTHAGETELGWRAPAKDIEIGKEIEIGTVVRG